MSNILLARIDSRLVHGQVATQWCREVGANMILVVNDAAAENRLRQELMHMATPAHVSLQFMTVENGCADIGKFSKRQKVLLVCAKPQDVLLLIENGIQIPKVNVGNLNAGEGKRQLTISVAVDKEEEEALKKIKSLGIEVEFRSVPADEPQSLETVFL